MVLKHKGLVRLAKDLRCERQLNAKSTGDHRKIYGKKFEVYIDDVATNNKNKDGIYQFFLRSKGLRKTSPQEVITNYSGTSYIFLVLDGKIIYNYTDEIEGDRFYSPYSERLKSIIGEDELEKYKTPLIKGVIFYRDGKPKSIVPVKPSTDFIK
ncbi:MAG: hypothetical protein JKY52_14125 [Flavobacteriales bacterium]|nr:hypothetical protein [Flavobacteriales bacterium]